MDHDVASELPGEADLNEFIAFCLDYFDLPEGVEVRRERGREFRMLFGTCAQAMRFVRGFLILRDAQMGIEGRLLARAALEYGATAQYAYLQKGGIDRLHRHARASDRSLALRMAKWTGNTDFQDMADSIEVPAGKRLPNTAGIFKALDPNDVFLQQTHAVFSQILHVTSSALTSLFVFDEATGALSLNHVAPPDTFRRETAYAVAMAGMMATWVVADIRDDTPMLEQLDGFSDDLRLPMRFDDAWSADQRARPSAPAGHDVGGDPVI